LEAIGARAVNPDMASRNGVNTGKVKMKVRATSASSTIGALL
jgi:hypothetical protein